MATLRGGPAEGLQIPDGSKDIEWVATTLDDIGRPIPDQPEPGHALVLPDDVTPATEALLNKPGLKWQCYRKGGAILPELGEYDPHDDLPIPTEGTVYRWVCRRREP